MKNIYYLLCLLFFCCQVKPSLYAQEGCEAAQSTTVFSGNQVEALLRPSGQLFWDGQQSGFTVNSDMGERVATIFAHGLWMGGKDAGGNLKVAAAAFGLAEGESDYYPGPLNNGDPDYEPGGVFQDPERGGSNAETCQDWDKIWLVSKSEIEAFQQDFQDNGWLDQEHPTVLAWPAVGNPVFFMYNGFELPEYTPEGLAPFFDGNGDGTYDPFEGDYPVVEQSAILPDLIAWAVYNESGNDHGESNSPSRLQFDIQQTTWAYACNENDWLNQSVFSSYKLTNKAIERIDSTYLGLWTDFDLGCPTDDYIGSAPDLNTFFAYNSDAIDGDESGNCSTDIASFSNSPPVQAITFLSQSMSSFMYYEGFGINSPPGLQTPQTAQEYYNYMSSRFRDGSSMVATGNGYDPNSTLPTTNYAFSGKPDVVGEWSLYQNPSVADRIGIGSADIGTLFPNGIMTIDVAYSFHHSPDSSFLQNVNLMYTNIPELQSVYNSGFTSLCGVTPIEEQYNTVAFSIFPNPASTELMIVASGDNAKQAMIYNAAGQEVARVANLSSVGNKLNVSHLAGGIYYIQILVGEEMAVKKFVKM